MRDVLVTNATAVCSTCKRRIRVMATIEKFAGMQSLVESSNGIRASFKSTKSDLDVLHGATGLQPMH